MPHALLIAASVALVAAGANAQGKNGVPDPDRGLPPELRARLALVDAALDQWPTERAAALVQARLDELADRWRDSSLTELPWIDAGLRVAPFFAAADASKEELPLAEALRAWRAPFDADARLEASVEAIALSGDEFDTRIRLVASGTIGTPRHQHTGDLRCTWRASEKGPVLVALEPLESTATTLHSKALFEDRSAEIFGDMPELRAQKTRESGGNVVPAAPWQDHLAFGLDHWRARLASNLELGLLGHHGLAVGDVDGDEREDIYVCQPGGLPNRLFQNGFDGGAKELAKDAGVDLLDYSSSALIVDLDEDGKNDLLVSTASALCFFQGDGAAHFVLKLRLERSLATSLAAADYDRDGDLDVFVCSYLSPFERQGLPLPYHDARNGERNVLLRNDRDWKFVDATAEAGLDVNNDRFSFAAAFEDLDDDGDQDLYVANDFGRKNLYRNDGGKFMDVAPALGVEDIGAGMGVTWGDVDEDGRADLYVTNMHSAVGSRLTALPDFRPGFAETTLDALRRHARGNALFLNAGERGFTDISVSSGTTRGRWGWGSVFLDFDNDGWLDLFAPNGFVTGERAPDLDGFFWRQVILQSPETADGDSTAYAEGWRAVSRLVRKGYSWNGHERNVALLNLGGARFADVSSLSGLDFPDDARAAAPVDWNSDGRLDLVVTNRTAPMVRMFVNECDRPNYWIAFRLVGNAPRSAVGARVTVTTVSGRRLVRTLRCGEGYLAQGTSRLHFGLGLEFKVKAVEVRWPDGTLESFTGASSGGWNLVQGTGKAEAARHHGWSGDPTLHYRPRTEAAAEGRTVLPTPLPLPRLALESSDGRAASVFGITMEGPRGTGQPLLILLFESQSEASRRSLESLAASAPRFWGAGLQVLALSASEEPERSAAQALLKEIEWPQARGWPHESGFATPEALQILELVNGAIHDSARALELPLAFLVDPKGQLVATYRAGFAASQVLEDRKLFELTPEQRRDTATPFAGRWLGPLPEPLDATVATRLAAHGLERSAAEYSLARVERRELSAGAMQYELGVARQKQGRLTDAIQHYRQALQSDPNHVLAAQCLAVALHQNGELDAALAAYRQALRLEPGDALTRCNLGFLQITRGDFAAARAELAALSSMKSELAPKLAEALRRAEAR